MESPKIKRYILRIFNYKIKGKASGLVQFEKSINKGLCSGHIIANPGTC